MAFETVKRNIYYIPDRLQLSTGNRKDVESQSELDCLEPDHIGKNHYEDFEEFHLPIDRMHNSNLHDWGIARGLEVTGTIGGGEVIINPGVAIDIDGQLISLSDTGHGDIGKNPPGGDHHEVLVPVKLSTAEYSAGKKFYVTIQFSEILRSDQGAVGMKEQVPWVRLQPIDSYISEKNNGSKSIILAVAVINDNGKLAELKARDGDLPNCRRLIGESVEELRIQRSGNDVEGTVQDIVTGKIGPGDGGGLKITVPDYDDSVLFTRENGEDFKSLGINANVGIGTTNPSVRLEVNGNIKANASELGTLVVKGKVGIGTTDPDCALHVNGTKIKLGSEKEGQLLIAGENNFLLLEANGSNDTGTVSELTICGNSTRNIPTLKLSADNTFFGGSITVPGTINSNQNLLVQDNVGIGTTTPSAKLNVDPQGRGGIVIGNPNTSAGGYTSLIMEISEKKGGYASLNCLKSSGSSGGDICLNPQGHNVGIGTINPSARLEVNGNIKANASELETLVVKGSVGIGTTDPKDTLDVYGQIRLFGQNAFQGSDPFLRINPDNNFPSGTHFAYRASFYRGITTGDWWDVEPGKGNLLVQGNVGIGTTNPSARLDIQGDIRINDKDIWLRGGIDNNHGIGWYGYGKPFAENTSIDGPVVFGYSGGALGTIKNGQNIALRWDVDGNICARGTFKSKCKDLAENYPSDVNLESGDVICLAQDKDSVVKSEKPNDPLVLGVVSTKPGFLLSDGGDAKEANLFPVALCGRVPCKVVDENGPIKRGDLLTSSSTPGHAMKASPIKDGEFFSPGTIIGKAIGTLESGRGVIDIFVLSS
ncbi:hypothetical protein ASJ81_04410 [Methanosarcina spelaei]|uniref:Uncharacterized protein n=1 Tax=Methanosarcina spelaei TaxID=1036679 RepID=A0A2A2HUR7_9EURY|nr:hypothetical protein [Methanosarcina spelaei]PAV12974.1 hypothetical protein ASJ81_04410 [Methanosarcina spelaei]